MACYLWSFSNHIGVQWKKGALELCEGRELKLLHHPTAGEDLQLLGGGGGSQQRADPKNKANAAEDKNRGKFRPW